MGTNWWIWIIIGVVFILIYILNTRFLIRKSKEEEKKIDYSKIKKWEDEEDQ